MPTVTERLQHAWNAFLNRDETEYYRPFDYGVGYSYRPDRPRLSRGNERSIVTAIYNRIAIDCAAINLQHVRLDVNGRYLETIKSGLNNCLTAEANIDQTGRAFIQDVVMSMLDEGCVAIVPTQADIDIRNNNSFDILEMRVGKITSWYPRDVRIKLYNDLTGQKEEIVLPKSKVAIVENPFYATMNETNSTLRRLIRKLNLSDSVDEQIGAGKMDLIIQLPYQIKTEARRKQAEIRRNDIENQLRNSNYGIAYTDGTERITQLNRPVENTLNSQVEYLTKLLYSQLGITEGILNGTASEQEMQNYYSRTIEPILSAIADEMKRKFLTKTARTQGQSIKFFRDPFKLIPITSLANIADTFTRNEILSSNEVRAIVGKKPDNNPKSDQLVNSNMPQSNNINIGQNERKEEETEDGEEGEVRLQRIRNSEQY